MMRFVSWPMYAADPTAIDAFWSRLREALLDAGIDNVPAALSWPIDLLPHWQDPALLLSQTCGYPLTTSLSGSVRYVATPRFDAPGCEGACYRSAIVVRRDDPAAEIGDMVGRRAAFNSRDSQSGYNCLRALVAPHARDGRFFSGAIETGAHRRSLDAVAAGMADLAAIDAVTLALIGDRFPEALSNLRVLCHTPLTPGLPLITAAATSDADLAKLRIAVSEACRGDRSFTRAMRLDGIEIMADGAYSSLLAMRDEAYALRYREIDDGGRPEHFVAPAR